MRVREPHLFNNMCMYHSATYVVAFTNARYSRLLLAPYYLYLINTECGNSERSFVSTYISN